MAATAAYTVAGLSALVLNYRRLTDLNERRRVKVLVIGAVGGLLPGLLVVASYRLRSHANLAQSIFASRATSFGTLTVCSSRRRSPTPSCATGSSTSG